MLEPRARRPLDHINSHGHSRSRTTSSNVFPVSVQGPTPPQQYGQPTYLGHTRRSPSVNTFSTTSSVQPPAAYRISSTTDLRRSTSSRSGGAGVQPSGYVALLRKQKATVWCDRAQYEDPRIAAQQRAAKKRANLEVVGGRSSSAYSSATARTSTGIGATGKVAAKIRHHGKTPVVGFVPGSTHVGVGGVPLRLSATEVEAESSDEEGSQVATRLHHRRTGSSGRSSNASARRAPGYRSSGGPSAPGRRWSPSDTPDGSGSMMEERVEEGAHDDAASIQAHSTKSASSGERADNITELSNAPRLASNSLLHSALTREKSVKSPEELKRRGSVDERTATLTSGRLFIANPD